MKKMSRCPTCHDTLTQSSADGSCLCLRCGGTWLPEKAAADFSTLRFAQVTGEVVALFGVVPECPSCGAHLSRRLAPVAGSIEACGACGGMWVGAGKLDRLQLALAGLTPREPIMPPGLTPVPWLWKTVFSLSALSAAAGWILAMKGM